MTPIPWQFSGPLNGSLRITFTGSGHYAQIAVMYQPSQETQATIAEQTAAQLSAAVFDASPTASSAATERYQRLLAEIATAHAKVAELDNHIEELTIEQDAANVEAKPGLGKRLVRIGKQIAALRKQREETAYEANLLEDVAARARADAERELLAAFARRQMTALGYLQARRTALERDLLDAIGQRLTQLIAADAALLRIRAGSSLHEAEVRRIVDALPPSDAGDEDAQDEAEGPDPEPQPQGESVAA